MTDELKHYGIRRQSGRYPWGSGGEDTEYQRSKDFYAYTEAIRNSISPPMSDKDLARLIGEALPDDAGYTVANLRDTRTIAKEAIVREQVARAQYLRFEKEWSEEAIAQNLGISKASVRARLKSREDMVKSSLSQTADVLKKYVDEEEIVDIGKGVGLQMNLSKERLRAAATLLRDEGYVTHNIPQPQVGSKNATNQLVMVKEGVSWGEARKLASTKGVYTIGDYYDDETQSYFAIAKPMAISSKRLLVKFKEDGGADEDGMVYVRRGVKDLDMGKNNYSQVRINIDDTHFIKGVALYKDDLPAGVDLVFNSNKERSVGKIGALKPLTGDKDNPFGSVIKKQIFDIDPKTGEKVLKSGLNIVNEEGDWDNWRLSLPSQMLAKQPKPLIESQLKVTRKQAAERIAELNAITNPVIRKKKLEDYADQLDADAVDLRAAAMPHQRTQLLIPVVGMSENQVYAPRFTTGENVVLIRYPHGGRFEIPELTVNNNLRNAKKLIGDAPDAIGISPKVAEKLSGADFDGDTAIVIPNPTGTIKGLKSSENIYQKAFEGYNPKEQYGGYEVLGYKTKKDGTPVLDKKGEPVEIGNFPRMKGSTGLEMGKITNLITDMQVQGAQPDHVIRAVKHSMVVIDAEKHKLDYRRSERDRGIAQLRDLYQKTVLPDGSTKVGGATTLLSKATAGETVLERKLRPARDGGPIDKETGALVWVETGKSKNKYLAPGVYADGKDGRPLITVPNTESYKRLSLTDDANTLVRDPNDPVERLYAEHANAMKATANEVRLLADRTPVPTRNPRATEAYRDEVDKLTADLKAAEATLPLQRKAQQYARQTVLMKRNEDPTLYADRDRKKKVEKQALAGARARLGLDKTVIEITDSQWDAIQANAVSPTRLRDLLKYADPKRVEQLSMPRTNVVMTSAVTSRAKAMLAAGATTAEVARSLGIPQSTLTAAADRGEL